MQLSRNVKQNGATGLIALLTVIAHLFLFMTGEELEFADTLTFAGMPVDLKAALDARGSNVVPVEFKSDMTIEDTENVTLLGNLDLTARAGDVLIFRKEDERWIEVGRYLID